MRVLGIIAEYNPFHNGHQYHMREAKRQLNADYCIIIMSGNYVQRGEPAIIHKWKRAEMCLLGGADLVIELPLCYSTASAEFFADGAIKLLNSTNVVDYLSFGAECASIDSFENVLQYIIHEPAEYKKLLKASLSNGHSFPKARAEALARLTGLEPEIYDAPNNILAIEYLKAIKKTASPMKPHIISRYAANHNSCALGERFSSASAIRKAILNGDMEAAKGSLPPHVYSALLDSGSVFPVSFENFSDMLIYKIKTEKAYKLREILDVSEGLENRIEAASENLEIASIISQIKTKRYTFTKIQRILIHILLGITKTDMNFLTENGPPYIRVLGFKRSSHELLKCLTFKASLPVIVNLKKDMEKLQGAPLEMLQKEISATDVYFSKCGQRSLRRKGIEYAMPPIFL